MSADNGIYILKTPKSEDRKSFVYRVSDLQAIDNLYWDDKLKQYTVYKDIIIENARLMFDGCELFDDEIEALKYAVKLYKSMSIVEYGIQIIEINRVF